VPDDAATGFKGRLTYVANANSSTLFGSFDAMGRVLNSTQTTNGITYPQFSYGYCGHRASAIIVPRSRDHLFRGIFDCLFRGGAITARN